MTGIAGIGKSRLAWEFYKYFDGIAATVYWHRGRCPAYGDGVTYWALADMVRMRCRTAEDEEPEAALEKLVPLVRKEILGLHPDPRSPEHGQYGFLQDLSSEGSPTRRSPSGIAGAAISPADQLATSLGPPRRRARHLRAARGAARGRCGLTSVPSRASRLDVSA